MIARTGSIMCVLYGTSWPRSCSSVWSSSARKMWLHCARGASCATRFGYRLRSGTFASSDRSHTLSTSMPHSVAGMRASNLADGTHDGDSTVRHPLRSFSTNHNFTLHLRYSETGLAPLYYCCLILNLRSRKCILGQADTHLVLLACANTPNVRDQNVNSIQGNVIDSQSRSLSILHCWFRRCVDRGFDRYRMHNGPAVCRAVTGVACHRFGFGTPVLIASPFRDFLLLLLLLDAVQRPHLKPMDGHLLSRS